MTSKSDQLFLTRAMASIVSELNPGKLEQLRERFPASAELFEVEYVMGQEGAGAAPQAKPDPAVAAAVKALIEETVQSLGPAIHSVQLALVQRVRNARRLRLAGSIVATISSAGAVATLTATQPSLTPVAAVVSLVAALAMLLGEHLEKPVMGGSKSLSELLGNVIAAEPVVQEIKLQLMLDDLTQAGPLMEMARKLNEIAANVKYASLYGGVPLAQVN